MKKPKFKEGEIIENIHNRKRLAIVKRLIKDWDDWAYEVAEAQYNYKKKEVKFDDIFILRGRETWHWRSRRNDPI